MNANFCKKAFNVNGTVSVMMKDGRYFNSNFPSAVWRWLDNKDWASVTVWNSDFGQSYGWDRV